MQDRMLSRLVLGTVQFGMNYGIANANGKPDFQHVVAILDEAFKNGVRLLDTAQAYGDSENILGKALTELGITSKAKIISKPSAEVNHCSYQAMREAVYQSIERLGTDNLHCLLLHDETLLTRWDHGVGEALDRLREEGIVGSVGVSVYSPEAAEIALGLTGLEAVQFPGNPLDRRFESPSFNKLIRLSGKRTYVRSVFLQGLLLMDAESLPEHMTAAKEYLLRYHAIAIDHNLSPAALAMLYVRQAWPEANILFGVDTKAQLLENLNLWSSASPSGVVEAVQQAFLDVPETILNPSKWNTL